MTLWSLNTPFKDSSRPVYEILTRKLIVYIDYKGLISPFHPRLIHSSFLLISTDRVSGYSFVILMARICAHSLNLGPIASYRGL
jgi:hypothetical protein